MMEAILAILLSFRPFFADTETLEERRERLDVVARSIEAAAERATCTGEYAATECRPVWHDTRRSLVVALIVLGHQESRYAQYVHEDRCLDGPPGMRCDLDRNGVPRARGPWQAWRVACPDLWDEMAGTSLEATTAAAWCTARRFAQAYRRCQKSNPDPWAGAFSGYTGASCNWAGAVPRSEQVRKLLRKL
jgi:hypothetical protein